MFLKHAAEFNDNISISSARLAEIDWNSQNYTQFSKNNGDEVIVLKRGYVIDQHFALRKTRRPGRNKKETVCLYSAVRKAHNDILNSK
ncbi:MAG: hypothetical protein ABW019_13420 [Chitinophagaceae bacterium]